MVVFAMLFHVLPKGRKEVGGGYFSLEGETSSKHCIQEPHDRPRAVKEAISYLGGALVLLLGFEKAALPWGYRLACCSSLARTTTRQP
jgi:hypothetical protein